MINSIPLQFIFSQGLYGTIVNQAFPSYHRCDYLKLRLQFIKQFKHIYNNKRLKIILKNRENKFVQPLGVVKTVLGMELGLNMSELGWLDVAAILPYAVVQIGQLVTLSQTITVVYLIFRNI